jgi:hypothetical protein
VRPGLDLAGDQDPGQRGFLVRVVGGEEPPGLAAREQRVLGSRAALEDADRVLEALRSGTGGLRAAHRVGHVADESQAAAPAFLGNREVRVARDARSTSL